MFRRPFTIGQFLALLTTPIEPLYIVGSPAFALWYFGRFIRPVSDDLCSPARATADAHRAPARLKRFAPDYWSVFLVYLVPAPSWRPGAARHTLGADPGI